MSSAPAICERFIYQEMNFSCDCDGWVTALIDALGCTCSSRFPGKRQEMPGPSAKAGNYREHRQYPAQQRNEPHDSEKDQAEGDRNKSRQTRIAEADLKTIEQNTPQHMGRCEIAGEKYQGDQNQRDGHQGNADN